MCPPSYHIGSPISSVSLQHLVSSVFMMLVILLCFSDETLWFAVCISGDSQGLSICLKTSTDYLMLSNNIQYCCCCHAIFPLDCLLFSLLIIDERFYIYGYMWISKYLLPVCYLPFLLSLNGVFWRISRSFSFIFPQELSELFFVAFIFLYKYGDEFVNFHFNCLHYLIYRLMYRLIWEKNWHLSLIFNWVILSSTLVYFPLSKADLIPFLLLVFQDSNISNVSPQIKVLPAQKQTLK